MENNQPIIVKRVKKGGAGHHGGAWKIAFADFATAMMAFFLVLWLMSSATPEQKKQISGYFQDPVGFSESNSPYVIDLGGSPQMSPDRTLNQDTRDSPDDMNSQEILENKNPIMPSPSEDAEQAAEKLDQERLELLMKELQEKIDASAELQNYRDQIHLEVTPDGLRIQITDADRRPMFDSGSARLQPYFEDILLAMADTIKGVPNKISVSGHTDAKPYAGQGDFGNWELSANRANAARRALIWGGYPDGQVARVVGFGPSQLQDKSAPFDPVNRRIDIVVLSRRAQRAVEGGTVTAPPEDDGTPDVPAAGDIPQIPQPASDAQRRNFFESDNGALDNAARGRLAPGS